MVSSPDVFLLLVIAMVGVSIALSLDHKERDPFERKVPEEEMKPYLSKSEVYKNQSDRK